jgi:hypothetical protein
MVGHKSTSIADRLRPADRRLKRGNKNLETSRLKSNLYFRSDLGMKTHTIIYAQWSTNPF